MPSYTLTIKTPAFLDCVTIAPLLLLRRIWYGYTFRRIPLKNLSMFAIVEPADFHALSQYAWWAKKNATTYMAVRFTPEGSAQFPVYMHRQLMKSKLNAVCCTLHAKLVVDHINRKGLDNRRANLRLATHAQNNMNRCPRRGTSSKYKGIAFDRRVGKYKTDIQVNKKRIHLGYFNSETRAAKAYDDAAKAYHGEFAYLNFPDKKNLPQGLRRFFIKYSR